MQEILEFTRTDLVEAFRQWHAGIEKDASGNLVGVTPDDPEAQADILIGFLKQPG